MLAALWLLWGVTPAGAFPVPETPRPYIHCHAGGCVRALENLPAAYLDALGAAQAHFLGRPEPSEGPNCYWTAMRYHFATGLPPDTPLERREFEKLLAASFVEIHPDARQRGDILVVEGSGERPDITASGRRSWFPMRTTLHAGLTLDERSILQKENRYDPFFSLTDLGGFRRVGLDLASRELGRAGWRRIGVRIRTFRPVGEMSPLDGKEGA